MDDNDKAKAHKDVDDKYSKLAKQLDLKDMNDKAVEDRLRIIFGQIEEHDRIDGIKRLDKNGNPVMTADEAVQAYRNMGVSNPLSNAEEYQKFKELYKSNISNYDPNNPEVHLSFLIYMGEFYKFIGDYEESINAYKEVIRINPKNAKAYASLGMAYYYSKQYQEAIEVYNKALSINPNDVEALIGIDNAHRELLIPEFVFNATCASVYVMIFKSIAISNNEYNSEELHTITKVLPLMLSKVIRDTWIEFNKIKLNKLDELNDEINKLNELTSTEAFDFFKGFLPLRVQTNSIKERRRFVNVIGRFIKSIQYASSPITLNRRSNNEYEGDALLDMTSSSITPNEMVEFVNKLLKIDRSDRLRIPVFKTESYRDEWGYERKGYISIKDQMIEIGRDKPTGDMIAKFIHLVEGSNAESDIHEGIIEIMDIRDLVTKLIEQIKEIFKSAKAPWSLPYGIKPRKSLGKQVEDLFTQPSSSSYSSSSSSSSGTSSTSSGGCFIATAVYGSYDAHEVLVLRQWRNSSLSNTHIGQRFIRLYYKVSPDIASWIRNRSLIKILTRKLLDVFIKTLLRNYR